MSLLIHHKAIGVIQSPYSNAAQMPIQGGLESLEGSVVLEPEYALATRDLDGFERIWLLYVCHKSKPWKATVTPFLDSRERGLFSTRAPSRPNAIGMSVVTLTAVEGRTLRVRGLDILDGTPLLDIKPYVPRFDAFPQSRAGWLDQVSGELPRSDGRFSESSH